MDNERTLTAFADSNSLGVVVMLDGSLERWIIEPVTGDYYDAYALMNVDTSKALSALEALGYTTVGNWDHDGLGGLMVTVRKIA